MVINRLIPIFCFVIYAQGRDRYDSFDEMDERDRRATLKSSMRASSSSRAMRGRDDDSPPRVGDFHEGMKVEARYQGHGAWYIAKITRINPDRTFDVMYKDGEAATGLHHSTVRNIREGTLRPPPYSLFILLYAVLLAHCMFVLCFMLCTYS